MKSFRRWTFCRLRPLGLLSRFVVHPPLRMTIRSGVCSNIRHIIHSQKEHASKASCLHACKGHRQSRGRNCLRMRHSPPLFLESHKLTPTHTWLRALFLFLLLIDETGTAGAVLSEDGQQAGAIAETIVGKTGLRWFSSLPDHFSWEATMACRMNDRNIA